MELNALAFNPRMHLFSSGTAYDLMLESGNQAALDELQRLLSKTQWAVYRVQRIYKQLVGKSGKPFVNSDRKVTTVAIGSREAVEQNLGAIAQEYEAEIQNLHGKRFYVHTRSNSIYPAYEEFYVVAPHLAKDKCRNPKAFEQQWRELTGQIEQLSLL